MRKQSFKYDQTQFALRTMMKQVALDKNKDDPDTFLIKPKKDAGTLKYMLR